MPLGVDICVIGPDLRSGARRLPCSLLGEWLTRGRPRRFSKPAQQQALLLAALNRNLFTALALDLVVPVGDFGRDALIPPEASSLRVQCRSLALRTICPRDFVLPRRSGPLVLLSQTYSLLARLPITWAEKVVAWAPPIVSGRKPHLMAICANLTSAWIAHARLLDGRVQVRVAEQKRFLPPIVDLAQVRSLVCVALPRLVGVCDGLKQEIADFSDDVVSGQWEDQLRRAMTYRYRQRARNELQAAQPTAAVAAGPETLPGWQGASDMPGAMKQPRAPDPSALPEDDLDATTDE